MTKLSVNILIDRTGSMYNAVEETVHAVNNYLKTLRDDHKKSDKTRVNITTFDAISIDRLYEDVALEDMPEELPNSILQPRDMTNLFDAVGKEVNRIKDWVESKKGDWKVAFVVCTDGEENFSKEYRADDVKRLLKEAEGNEWLMTYLGADHDAFNQAGSLGFSAGNTIMYRKANTEFAVAAMSAMTNEYKGGATLDSLQFSEEDRKLALDGEDETV